MQTPRVLVEIMDGVAYVTVDGEVEVTVADFDTDNALEDSEVLTSHRSGLIFWAGQNIDKWSERTELTYREIKKAREGAEE